GWQANPNWIVRDGILQSIASGAPRNLLSERKDFASFHLRAETRINDGGNSGIFFRYPGPWNPTVYEAQIALDADPIKTGSLWNLGVDRAVRETLTKPGEWFTLEIIAIDNDLIVKVNGKMTTHWVDPDRTYLNGCLALQQYSPTTLVQFRKIEIKELPASPPGVPKQAADVLPYLAGNWKLESLNRDPKSPPATDPFVGTFPYSFVAGGKCLRGRSSVVPTSDARTGTIGLLDLWSFESDKNMMRRWVARSDGWTSGSVTGQFAPASRTLTTSVRIGDIDSVHQYEFIGSNSFNHHIFRKDASGTITSEVHSKWTRVGGPVVLPNVPLDPNRPAETKVLDGLVGEWQNDFTIKSVGSSDKPKA